MNYRCFSLSEFLTTSRFHVPLAVHLQLEDASPYDFGAAFAIPAGPPGATFSTFLPLGWFRKQLLRRCRSCYLQDRINGVSAGSPLPFSSVAEVYVLYQQGPFRVKLRQIRSERQAVASSDVPSLVLSDAKAWMLVKASLPYSTHVLSKSHGPVSGLESSGMDLAALLSQIFSIQPHSILINGAGHD